MELMSLDAWCDLTEDAQQVLLLQSSDVSSLNSPADLERRVIEYVHMNCLDGAPVSMATLNRRFGRQVRKFGVKLMDFLIPVFSRGVLRGKRVGAATLVFTPKSLTERGAMAEDLFGYEKDINKRVALVTEALDKFWDNAR